MDSHLNAGHAKVRSIQVTALVVRQDFLVGGDGLVDQGFSRQKSQAMSIVIHYVCLLAVRLRIQGEGFGLVSVSD